MTIYAVALSKGGSTKTTTAAELAATLAAAGRRVLAIDLDEQGNLTTRLGVTEDAEVSGVAADVLIGDATAEEAAFPSPTVPGVDILCGTFDLEEISTKPEIMTALRDYLPSLATVWDDVVIDTPPALGTLTLGALAAADVIVSSVSCETESYEQLPRLEEVIQNRIAKRLRPGQALHWIIPTKHDGRRLLDREVVQTLHELYPGRVTSTVREAVAVKDSYTAGMPVGVYYPGSPIAEDYKAALGSVVAGRVNNWTN